MQDKRKIWLITNTASGSNDAPAIEAIEQACDGGGLTIAHRSTLRAFHSRHFRVLAHEDNSHHLTEVSNGMANW